MKITCTCGEQSIGDFITRATWSGDESQAARKLEFSIAYNPKDVTFTNLKIPIGARIKFTVDNYHIFSGRIFYRKRTSNTYTYDFTAYDDMIYLAKSKMSKLFDKVSATTAIKQVCNEIGIPVSKDIMNISTLVTFFADNMSCTEIFEKIFELAKADRKEKYAAIYINDAVTVVKRGTLIENYIASDTVDVISSDHSESIEDMINRVKLVDEKGSVISVVTNDEDIANYGILQDIHKIEPPREGQVDNMAQARAKLKSVKNESSLNAVGNIQCITGYTVAVQEEQLKGNFYIKSDSHAFENNKHMMTLTLEYIEGSAVYARNK